MDKDLDISSLDFDLIDLVAYYTGNNSTNKSMEAKSRIKIANALLQLEENIHKIYRQLNAYDASSILMAESNWMKRNHFSKYMPNSGSQSKKIEFGHVCTIDYGKTYKGELGYIHPGLCVGKKYDKYLIVPMTTGRKWRSECYHPTINPNMSKENRQSCQSEGFKKDGVLLISDAKFISGGRILDVHEKINDDVLKSIQEQLLHVMFPSLSSEIQKIKQENIKLSNELENKEKQIMSLKKKNSEMSNKIHKLGNNGNSV